MKHIRIDWNGLLPVGAKRVADIPPDVRAAMMAMPEVRQKFEQMYQGGSSDECWPWLRSKSPAGYGHFCIGQVRITATRVSWEIYCGPIPDGIDLLHRCDNPPCVNPNHLFLGTAEDNGVDMSAKGRAVMPDVVGEANCAAKLTDDDVRDIRRSPLTGAELAVKYGVTATTISDARGGYTWPHIVDVAPIAKRSKAPAWSDEGKIRLVEMAGRYAVPEIMRALGRNKAGLYTFASRNGISLQKIIINASA